jgi:hypothetical protein
MDRLELVLEGTPGGGMADPDIVIIDEAVDVTLPHLVHDRLHVASTHRHVVRGGSGTVGRHGDGRGRRAAGGSHANWGTLELRVSLDVERLASVVLETLVDDRQYIMLGERSQLAGVGTFVIAWLFMPRFSRSHVSSDYIITVVHGAGRSWADYPFVTA